MIVSRVAYRYAEAVYGALPADVGEEAVFADFLDLRASIRQSRELQLFFASPVISRANKLEAITALFADRMHPYVLDVLKLLVEKTREHLIPEIIEAMLELRRKRNNTRLSRVTSAVELTAEQRGKLTAALERASKGGIEADFHVDPAIIGGVTVRIEDKVYDGSIANQLRKLRTRFATGS